MSGGAYDYAFEKVERFAEALEQSRNFDGRELPEPNGHDRIGNYILDIGFERSDISPDRPAHGATPDVEGCRG